LTAPDAPEAEGPVFAEAWHAEVLAIAHGLGEAGMFTPGDWAEALGASLRRAQAAGAPDTDATYYAAALAALEGLVAARAPATSAGLPQRIEDWRKAYLTTPHGQPVELKRGK
jgi:nitrile hydratase accessory protein